MADFAGLRIGVTADTRDLEKQIRSASMSAGTEAGRTLGESIGSGIGKATSAIGNALASVTKVAAGALGGATIAAAGLGVASFQTAARVGEMDATLRALSKGNADVYATMTRTVDTVRKQGIEAGVAQGLVAQFTRSQLDLGRATDLATVAQNAAVISGRNSTEVLDDLVHGITTQNSLVLRNAGVNVQAGQAMDIYAASLGKASKDLTDAERSQAVLNAVIEAGGPIAGAYAAAMEEPGKVLRSFPRVFDDIKLSVGKGLVDAFGPLILKTYDFAKTLSAALEPGGKLAPILDAIGKAATTLVEPLTGIVTKMTAWLKGVDPAAIANIADAIGRFAPVIASAGAGLATFAGGGIIEKIPVVGQLLGNLGGPMGAVVAGVAALVATSPELRGAFGEVLAAAQPLLGIITSLGQDVLAQLMPALGQLAPVVVTVGKALVSAVGGLTPIIPVVGQLAQIIAGALGQALGVLADLIVAILPVVVEVAGILAGFFAAALKALLPAVVALMKPLAGLVAAAVQLLPPIAAVAALIAGALVKAVVALMPVIIRLVETVLAALLKVLPTIVDAFLRIADVLIRALLPVFDALIPVVIKVIDALLPIVPIVAELIAVLATLVADVLGALLPAFLALIPAVVAILGALLPLLPAIVSLLPPILSLVQALTPIIVLIAQLAAVIIQVIVYALGPILTLLIDFAVLLIGQVVGAVAAVIGIFAGLVGAFGWVIGAAKSVFGWLRDNWGLILAILTGPFGLAVLAILKSWDTIKDGVMGVVDWFKGVPRKILDALGDLGNLLFDAGRKIIEGLIKGITDKMGDLADTVGGIAGKIRGWKGPLDYDRTILQPAGKAIMAGLTSSLEAGLPDLHQTMASIGDQLSVSGAAAFDMSGAGAGAAGGPAIVIQQADFHDEADIEVLMRKAEFAVVSRAV